MNIADRISELNQRIKAVTRDCIQVYIGILIGILVIIFLILVFRGASLGQGL